MIIFQNHEKYVILASLSQSVVFELVTCKKSMGLKLSIDWEVISFLLNYNIDGISFCCFDFLTHVVAISF